MKFHDLRKQFSSKERSIQDLARFIKNRTDHNPNYCLLMGAGCSITSGIRSAAELVKTWREQSCSEYGMQLPANEEEQKEFLRGKASEWYDVNKEYSSLFERRFDLQRQRRVFVESEVAGKLPSIGYAYLTSLVDDRYFNTIFTTNFDDLVNEAFYLFSTERPIVCAHDSSINSVTVTSSRPKVIKLHGDYLFDDLKSTLRETESLEQNMKAKLAEFSKDHGLIVIGYSGSDRSIMDNLQTLLRNDEYLKSGIYWCMREDADVPEELRKLLFRDRVYYVKIGGFDELMAELYASFNPGKFVPDTALMINRRSSDTLKKLLNSAKGVPQTTDLLKKARTRLERHSKRAAIASLIAKDDRGDEPDVGGTEYTDDELLLISEISELVATERYEEVLQRAREELMATLRPPIRRELIERCITANICLDRRDAALGLADEIIRENPNRASSYVKKSTIYVRHSDKREVLDKAIACDEYSVEAWLAKGRLNVDEAGEYYGARRRTLLDEALANFDRAIKIDPSRINPAWREKFSLVKDLETDRKRREDRLHEIISSLSDQNPFSPLVLDMRRSFIALSNEKNSREQYVALLQDLDGAEKRYPESESYSRTRMRVYAAMEDYRELRQIISAKTELINKDPDLAALVARLQRQALGDDIGAIKVLRDSLRLLQFDWEVATQLVVALCDTGQVEEAQQTFDRWQLRLGEEQKNQMTIALLEARGDFDGCISEIRSYQSKIGLEPNSREAYFQLCKGDAPAAKAALRAYLNPLNYTPEAVVEICNLELARKLTGEKVDANRLTKVLDYSDGYDVKVAVYALLENKVELYAALRKLVTQDKTRRYDLRRWPVLSSYRTDPNVESIINASFSY
ncbi:SIR2 family protein [Pseudacidovorax sp. NFM-22]|uniref:SIR2 family protein n=1 Tax=Pseudacidovorax sp. NFM-22 TaxID=2744469 RepID=UPI001F47A8F5|nr:SIR2 family protein [Pseudacidovorax sp. NFM-22]